MPEEATQAPEETQDTPTPTDEASPEETPSTETETDTSSETPEDNSQKRIEDFQRIATQAQQEAAEYRRIVEAARAGDPEALNYLGYEKEEEDKDDDEYVDPDERVERLEQRLAEREEAEADAQFERAEQEWLKRNISELEKKESLKLSEKARRFIISDACAHRFEDGQPDLEGAIGVWKDASAAEIEAYVASKKAPKVGVGTAGQKTYDLTDDDQRLEAMKAEMDAAKEGSDS